MVGTKGKLKRIIGESSFYLVLALILFVAFFPVFWTLMTSFKTMVQTFSIPPKLLFSPTLYNWKFVLRSAEFRQNYLNSLIIGGSTVAVVLLVGSLAGYALARFPVGRKEDIAFWILSQRMMPPVAIVIPIYILFFQWHIHDTYPGIVLLYTAFNLPMAVWMMRGFFEALPPQLEEAARIDGASNLGAFFRVALPLAKPGLVACGVFSFFMCINEFLFAFIIAPSKVRPVSVAVTLFLPTGIRATMYGEACAAAILIALPGVVVATLMQRYLVRGMTFGALK